MWVALDWLYAKLDCVEYEMWCRSGKYNGRLEKQNCAKDFLTSVRGTGRNLIHWICYSAYVATCLVKIFYYWRPLHFIDGNISGKICNASLTMHRWKYQCICRNWMFFCKTVLYLLIYFGKGFLEEVVY